MCPQAWLVIWPHGFEVGVEVGGGMTRSIYVALTGCPEICNIDQHMADIDSNSDPLDEQPVFLTTEPSQ